MTNLRRPIAACLVAIVGVVAAIIWRSDSPNSPVPRVLQVQVLNERLDSYVWVDGRVGISIWMAGSDASDDPIVVTVGKLVLPHNRLGNGFQVPENSFSSGYISLPKDFELERYLREGLQLQLAVAVVPRGIFTDEAPFEPRPGMEWSNAYATVPLNVHFPPKIVYLALPVGG